MHDTFTITLARGSFRCAAGETILEAGRRAGWSFPHACRNGVCERCEGRLLAGAIRNLRTGARTAAGHAGSDRVLYCVATPLSDCEIDVPDVLAPGELPVHEVGCQVVDIAPLNADVFRVMLRLPAGRRIRWHAGQYLELLIPGVGDSAFSIACAPGGRDLELHVRTFADNRSALEVMDYLRANPVVRARLPGGRRCLRALPDRAVTFICGSTGFAPVKAMIEFLRAENFRLPVRLYWGGRRREDLYLEALVRQWAAEMPNLTLTLALSEAAEPGFHHGPVHEAALRDLPAARDALFYVGGSPPMAWATFDALVAAGVPADDIHSDVFDYAPRT